MTNRMLHNAIIAAVAGIGLAAGGTALAGESSMQASDSGSSMSQSQMTASLSVKDQEADDNSVTVDDVQMPTDGYVVIHAAKSDGSMEAPQSIGHTMAQKGKHDSVSVKLDKPVKSGDKLFAMLHKDTGKKGEYRFAESGGKDDGAVMANGKPVIKSFMVK